MSAIVEVSYDPSFSRPNTWMLADDSSKLRARVRLGGEERVVDAEIRWLRPIRAGRAYAYPVDGEMTTWLTEPTDFGGQLPARVRVRFAGAPAWVAETMRSW